MAEDDKPEILNWLYEEGHLSTEDKIEYDSCIRQRTKERKEKAKKEFNKVVINNKKVDTLYKVLVEGDHSFTDEDIINFIKKIRLSIP